MSLESNQIRNILIKSSERVSGSSHDFIVSFKDILEGRYLVKYVLIANSLYNVNDDNNKIYFYEDSTEKIATITNGNYTDTSFPTILKTVLDTASGGYNTYTVSHDTDTGKLTFTAGNNFYFTFGTNTSNSARKPLGFTETDGTAGTTQTSDNLIDLGYPLSLGINFDNSSTVNYNTTVHSMGSIYVPLNISFGYYQTLSPNDLTQIVEFNRCRNLSVKVVNTVDNQTVDLNGTDFEFLLQLVHC